MENVYATGSGLSDVSAGKEATFTVNACSAPGRDIVVQIVGQLMLSRERRGKGTSFAFILMRIAMKALLLHFHYNVRVVLQCSNKLHLVLKRLKTKTIFIN